MATTNLIVDYFIIGSTSLIWLAPLLFLIQGDKWLSWFQGINLAAGFILLGFIYVLGITISRLADDLSKSWNDRVCDGVFGKSSEPTYHNQLNFIIAKSHSASEYLSYRRSIVRVSRAASVNFLLGFLFWLFFFFTSPVTLPKGTDLMMSVLSLIVLTLSVRELQAVLGGYFHSIKDMYQFLSKEEAKDA
jgi:hypothetical protein